MPLNLNRFLLKEGTDLNFFQAVHLLERLFRESGKPGTGDDMRSEPVRFETLNSLSFPPAEVAGVLPPLSFRNQAAELDTAKRGDEPPADPDALPPIRELVKAGNGPLRMSLTFMGLYGVSSPLPSYFTDPITLRKLEYFELKKFLDIFTHRLYSLFYRSWKKYRHHPQYDPHRPDDFTLRLLALTGQWPRRKGKAHVQGESAEFNLRRIPYARFLGNRVRSAKGLQQLLRGYFGFGKVRIRQFEPAWVEIPVKTRLGEGMVTLGRSTRLGDRMQDRLSRFTVEIGPLPRAAFNGFLPSEQDVLDASLGRRSRRAAAEGTDASGPGKDGLPGQVREVIDAYLRDPLDYQVKVILEPEGDRIPVLGSGHARMGMGVWLGERPKDEIACRL
ncbi:MAG TPA: type VI secretion system baseplate subunit TssG [Fibrobacteria bacterium]|nr:type VI secretion system baseplate subunit TssG [Fibrobacteria bacterium]